MVTSVATSSTVQSDPSSGSYDYTHYHEHKSRNHHVLPPWFLGTYLHYLLHHRRHPERPMQEARRHLRRVCRCNRVRRMESEFPRIFDLRLRVSSVQFHPLSLFLMMVLHGSVANPTNTPCTGCYTTSLSPSVADIVCDRQNAGRSRPNDVMGIGASFFLLDCNLGLG